MASGSPTERTSLPVLLILAVFAVAMAIWDLGEIHAFHDTFLPPPFRHGGWEGTGDWSAVHSYPDDWKLILTSRMTGALGNPATEVLVVLGAHLLLWSGIYFAARALCGGSAWVALLAVALARIVPDLYQIDLLSAAHPARLIAVALLFWTMGLLIREQWMLGCCLAGAVVHFSPTLGIWFVQVLLIALIGYEHERGWRKPLIGTVEFLIIAAVPISRFLLNEIRPEPPIDGHAMLGVHFFAEPQLSPFYMPPWVAVCTVLYVAMTLVWMKRHFRRKTYPPVVVLFIIAWTALIIELLFLGMIPAERTVRFRLHEVRAHWLVWVGIVFAPELARLFGEARKTGRAWQTVLRGLVFSLPIVWAFTTLIERFHKPPRWNILVTAGLLILLVVTIAGFPLGNRPIAEGFFAAMIGLAVLIVLGAKALVTGIDRSSWLTPFRMGLGLFLLFFALINGSATVRSFEKANEGLAQTKQWRALCRWVRDATPSELRAKWAIDKRPRDFRRRTQRPVLVNRVEIPPNSQRRLEWFLRFMETHCCSEEPDCPIDRALSPEKMEKPLREFADSFLFWREPPLRAPETALLVSATLVRKYNTEHAVLDSEGGGVCWPLDGAASITLRQLHAAGTLSAYQIEVANPPEEP
jgi:hypothetical protein